MPYTTGEFKVRAQQKACSTFTTGSVLGGGGIVPGNRCSKGGKKKKQNIFSFKLSDPEFHQLKNPIKIHLPSGQVQPEIRKISGSKLVLPHGSLAKQLNTTQQLKDGRRDMGVGGQD